MHGADSDRTSPHAVHITLELLVGALNHSTHTSMSTAAIARSNHGTHMDNVDSADRPRRGEGDTGKKGEDHTDAHCGHRNDCTHTQRWAVGQ